MEINYIFNSGFLIKCENFNMLIDYWRGLGEEELSKIFNENKKTYVLFSHSHKDHYNPKLFDLATVDTTFILAEEIKPKVLNHDKNICYLSKGETYADDHLQVKAYGSTDIGISFAIEADGCKIFHAGDLNNWHWADESTADEIKESETAFLNELADLHSDYKSFDVAMFPVDARIGSDFDRGAVQFCEKIEVKNFIPMHFGVVYQGNKNYGQNYVEAGKNFILKRGNENAN